MTRLLKRFLLRAPIGAVCLVSLIGLLFTQHARAQLTVTGLSQNFDAGQDRDISNGWDSELGATGFSWNATSTTTLTNQTFTTAPINTTLGTLYGLGGAVDFPTAGSNADDDKASGTTWNNFAASQDASWEIWLKADDVTNEQVIWETGGSGDGASISITSSGNIRFVVKDNDYSDAIVSAAALDTTEFHQIVAVYDRNSTETGVNNSGSSDVLSLYVDGVLVAGGPGADPGDTQTAMHDWSGTDGAGLGGSSNGAGQTGGSEGAAGTLSPNTLDGQIAALRFYENTALTAAEINANILALTTADVYFDDGGTGSDWSTGENWDTNLAPSASQNAYVRDALTATITQDGAIANQVFVGDGSTDGTIVMSSGSWTIDSLLIGSGTATGEVQLNGGTVTIAESGNETQAVQIGNSTTGTGTLTIDGATVDVTGGRFEVGGPESAGTDVITATFNMVSGSVDINNNNFILGQGNDNSVSTINFSGGTFNTDAAYNVNDGTAVHNHSGGTLTVGGNFQLQSGGASMLFTLNQTGGTISVDRIVGRNGDSTLNVSGGLLEARNGYQSGDNGTSRAETFAISGTGTVILAGLVEDRANTTTFNLSGSGRLEITGSNTTRTIDNLSMADSSVLQLDLVDSVTGVSAPLTVNDTGTFTGTPTIELVDKLPAATSTTDVWTGGAGTWDDTGSNWSLSAIPAFGENTIPNGATFTVITSANAMTGGALVSSGTSGWTVSAPDDYTVEIERTGDTTGGAVMAVIDNAASIVTRNSDLNVNTTTAAGADAAGLTVSDGALTLTGSSSMILGAGSGEGAVDQTGGTITIGGDLLFGSAADDAGGVFHVTNDAVLSVAGNVVETDASVVTAQLYVDTTNATVGGDTITVHSFRLGQSAGQTGEFALASGQTLTTRGWLYVGNNGTGTLNVGPGSTVDAQSDVLIANGTDSAGALNVDGGDFSSNDFDTGLSAGTVAAVNISNTSGTAITLELLGDGVEQALNADSTSTFNVTGTDPISIRVVGDNFEVAEKGSGVTTFNNSNLTFHQDNNNFIWGQSDTSDAVFNLMAGNVVIDNAFRVNNGDGATGTGQEANLTGGTLMAIDVDMSSNSSAIAVLTIDGAAVTVEDDLNYRDNGTDTVNLRSGSLVFDDTTGRAGGDENVVHLSDHSGTNAFNWTGGLLAGVDTFNGDLVQNNTTADSLLRIGNSIDTMTIDGDYQLLGGTLEIEIGGSEAGVDFDLLQVTGIAELDGLIDALIVGPIDIYDTFEVMVADEISLGSNFAVSKDFAAVVLRDYALSGTADVLQLTHVPEPSTLLLAAIGLACLGLVGWRRRKRSGDRSA